MPISRPDPTSEKRIRSSEELTALVDEICARWQDPTPPVPVQAEFYPYTSLKGTARRRTNGYRFRLSDLLADAPRTVVEALILILLHRVEGHRPPTAIEKRYRDWSRLPATRERIRESRQRRGRKRMLPPKGKFHDLRPHFSEINSEFFNSEVEIQLLGWGCRPAKTILGHYDPAHRSITISPLLDHPETPPYVLRFVLFHEMLHAFLGEEQDSRGRIAHHRRFRAAERDFPDYVRAREFIRRDLCRLE